MDPQLHPPPSRHTPPQSNSDRISLDQPHLQQHHQRHQPDIAYPPASPPPQQHLQPPPSLDSNSHLTAAVGKFTEEWDATQRGSSIIDGPATASRPAADMQRSNSIHSYSAGDDQQLALARGNTLKKKASMRRTGSMRRSSSRRSNRAGSVRSLALQSSSDPDDASSAFYCPVPTSGTPTDVLAGRFQTWRKILKDLIAYFREIQSHYEHRSKSLVKLANVANNISTPPSFLKTAGLDDALQFLRNYNTAAIQEANKAKEIEEDVILALTGLRSDLQQKIKEIKHLSGDFKNSVDREMDSTRKAVKTLADALEKNEVDSASTTGKQDPYLLRLAVDRQVERQVDEENYLHQAYLNLEGSGRELESIVVGEIQKAYNAYTGILKREADNAYNVIEELRDGPIAMPKDQEWIHFVTHDDQIVDPTIPMRSPEQIHYPGQDHVSAQEIRAGLLERKSKYLKSYTAGWYVLSTTHLHEFKSADKAQAPVMSLYLPEQKLGSHSTEGGSSNKFVLKGRQTGTMHRGHTWVFRAESHDTMMAWYEDIKALTEKTPEERSQFVRTHSRSMSQSSRRSASSDGMVDEDDEEPFSASQMDVAPEPRPEPASRRPEPGGRFPSDIQVNAQRGLQAAQSPSSVSSGRQEYPLDARAMAASGVAPAAAYAVESHGQQDRSRDQDAHMGYGGTALTPMDEMPSQAAIASQEAYNDGVNPYTSEPAHQYPQAQQASGYFAAPIVASQARYEPSEKAATAGRSNPGYAQECREVDDEVEAYERRQNGQNGHGPFDLNGVSYVNGGIEGENQRVVGMTAGSIPRSETHQELALQSVPEAKTVDHVVQGDTSLTDKPTPQRPTETRADSVATLSNLPMPGKYPKGSGATSP
ncbi:phosphatidylinositol 4,5-bisphosphate-binding protein SLM1 [Hirsutella rhossiliensis]|uniref:Phosphatidylinositol 4,5-bisphosphate-binding protein SLM1 n=1 Tax=Hirsutella rhossiliensis TaxID=111463 RepID=A0A9P8MMV6_9HYPO|nr:phosphatidylinositol 4,5-bisphosphate-binding protein SLM1 [Hirsutella rhossiliensis]KAH0957990.1 phosphatidylinositol 4,5-bisphosphate-binding protein SLM1 [Hirsutella rhossiliensis]